MLQRLFEQGNNSSTLSPLLPRRFCVADPSTNEYESLSRTLGRCNNQLHPREIEDELAGLMVACAGSDSCRAQATPSDLQLFAMRSICCAFKEKEQDKMFVRARSVQCCRQQHYLTIVPSKSDPFSLPRHAAPEPRPCEFFQP